MEKTESVFRAWLVPSALIVAVFGSTYGISTAWDFAHSNTSRTFLDVVFLPDAAESRDVLGTIGQAVPGILGIAITVVAIIVELASNRYSSAVTELFIRDRKNFLFLSLLVTASIYPLWIQASYSPGYVPHAGLLVALFLASLSILALLPYFSYVFAFLAPKNIIDSIRASVAKAIAEQVADPVRSVVEAGPRRRLLETKAAVAGAVEQLADVALNSIGQRDRALAMDAVDAARGVVFDYFDQKPKLPPAWFQILPEERSGNPDYVTLSDEGLEDLVTERVWVELKVMKQLHLVFVQALNNLRDVNNLIGMFLKDVAIEAVKRDDRHALRLALKFFNTSLRSAFTAKDVRTAYNVLYQYRRVADHLIAEQKTELAQLVFGYLKYYGLLFDSGGLGFILETVAYDLNRLLRSALDAKLENLETLVGIFLEVDRPPDSGSSDVHLRGVRKAQASLAAFCVARGRRDLATRIGHDMKSEPQDRLRSIREELHAAERAFWEITDRGVNFDHVEPELRPHLDEFFDKILEVGPRGTGRIAAPPKAG